MTRLIQHTFQFSICNATTSQININPDTARHCSFQILSGDLSSNYRFKTAFYGLQYMPAEFQIAKDYTSVGLKKTICNFDDNLTLSRGSLENIMNLMYDCLQNLDADNLRIILSK